MNQAQQVEDLSCAEIRRGLADGTILLVDVREPVEFAAGRIAGAVLCPLSTFDARNLPTDGSRRVVFQCGTGKRSLTAARAYLAAGASGAAHLAGGLSAWTAEGLPVINQR